MTVCVAAIAGTGAILGISDRMITAGDIEFQPKQEKIRQVTTSIAVLTAGDAGIHELIYARVYKTVVEWVADEPSKWISVEKVAGLYRDYYIQMRKDEAERKILLPLGYTFETFKNDQKNIAPKLLENLTYQLQDFKIESISTIVVGIDQEGRGSHIYVVRRGNLTCEDSIGFCAIGIGSQHAESHFMLSGYTSKDSEAKALWTIFQAKKKAEVSPGVGTATDMCILGPYVGTYQLMQKSPVRDLLQDLEGFYNDHVDKIEESDAQTEEKIEQYIKNPSPSSSSQNQEVEFPSTSTSTSTSASPSEPPPEEA